MPLQFTTKLLYRDRIMIRCPYCKKPLKTWKKVKYHIVTCTSNTGKFLIDSTQGIISINSSHIKHSYGTVWDKALIILAIQRWYKNNNRVPRRYNFRTTGTYPSISTILKHFGSWDKAIKAAKIDI